MNAFVHQEPAPCEVERIVERTQRHAVDGSGGRVIWHTLGQGRPLVLLHGGHGTWLHWIRNIHALAESRMVCVPDLPGYGESDIPNNASLEELLRSLGNSLDALLGQGADFDLAGFSFGGLVATHLAVAYGGIRRLALLGTAGHAGARRPRAQLLSWRAPEVCSCCCLALRSRCSWPGASMM
ncbi:alpha/beta fold hydrolase [Bordetella sp. FB-8]|uniref:alpha/beta fold hydrolase n=1 Tax=Bordetella sp. FB-8 TaxID=1159870 RepID=UPI00037C58E3|nr:alpha/beta fold hydrolase [Bordetella sp. FB-8]